MHNHPNQESRSEAEAKKEYSVLGEKLRADFPLLRDSSMVYLDSAASAQKPEAVLIAMDQFYRTSYANIHRGVYPLSVQATEDYEKSRVLVSEFIGAKEPSEVVFTRGATEAINLVAHSWGNQFIGEGDEILITLLEHHSNIVPWQMLAERNKAKLSFVNVLPDGTLDLDDFEKKLNSHTKLFGVTMLANGLGIAPPLPKLIEQAHAAGALVLIDGAQGIAHMPVNINALGADFFVFSGHKIYGPSGIGALWARRELLDEMSPFQGGGDMIRSVSVRGTSYADTPQKFEAGTPDIAGAIGLGAAIKYLQSIGMTSIEAYELELVRYLERSLESIPELKMLGDAGSHIGLVCFAFDGLHPHDLAQLLSDKGNIAVRAGHHCAQPLLEHFGIPATTRASLGLYNTFDDIDRLCKFLGEASQSFGLRSRSA